MESGTGLSMQEEFEEPDFNSIRLEKRFIKNHGNLSRTT
jgi:hypothetical protein